MRLDALFSKSLSFNTYFGGCFMAQQILGTMTDSGNTLTLQGNALRTEDSIVALSNITQIKCIDDTPQYKLPWKLIAVLVVVGFVCFGAGFNDSPILILPGLGCFAGVGYVIYNYIQKKKIRIYALVIDKSDGKSFAFHSDDLNFLDKVKNTIFDAVQNGAARVTYSIDMSHKEIINDSIIAGGTVNAPINNKSNIVN